MQLLHQKKDPDIDRSSDWGLSEALNGPSEPGTGQRRVDWAPRHFISAGSSHLLRFEPQGEHIQKTRLNQEVVLLFLQGLEMVCVRTSSWKMRA